MPLYLFYTTKKSKMTKNSNQGEGPALNSLRKFLLLQELVFFYDTSNAHWLPCTCRSTHTRSSHTLHVPICSGRPEWMCSLGILPNLVNHSSYLSLDKNASYDSPDISNPFSCWLAKEPPEELSPRPSCHRLLPRGVTLSHVCFHWVDWPPHYQLSQPRQR